MISYVIFPPIFRAQLRQPNNIIVLAPLSSVSQAPSVLRSMKGKNREVMRTQSVCECVCGTRKTGAPGAIPTRDLPLRSRIHEPSVFNSYETA